MESGAPSEIRFACDCPSKTLSIICRPGHSQGWLARVLDHEIQFLLASRIRAQRHVGKIPAGSEAASIQVERGCCTQAVTATEA
jgi:hypothetical protein